MHENKTIVWGAPTVAFDGGRRESEDAGVGLSVGTEAGDAGEYVATVLLAGPDAESALHGGLVSLGTEAGDAGEYTATVASVLTGDGDAGAYTATVEIVPDRGDPQTATIPIATGSGDAGDYTATVAAVTPASGPGEAGESTGEDGDRETAGLFCAVRDPAGFDTNLAESRNHGFFAYSGLRDGRGVIDISTSGLASVDTERPTFMVDAGGLGPETHITLTGDDPDDTVRIGGTDRPRFLTGRVDPNSEQGILLSAVDVGGNETQIISLRDGNPTLEFEVTGAPGNDWITTYTDPDPEVLGQELSTFGDKSIEEIIQSRPEAFEQACGCSLGAPDRIDVRRPDTPTEIRLDEAAIGGTVLAWNGSGWAPPADGQELPETVPLMGTEAPVGYFAFLTDREGGDGVRATLLMAAVTDRTSSGDIVVASHVAERQHPPVESTIEVVGQTGIFTLGEVAGIADRFAPVCPSMTTTIDIPEATGTEAS